MKTYVLYSSDGAIGKITIVPIKLSTPEEILGDLTSLSYMELDGARVITPSTEYVDVATKTIVPRPTLTPTISATSVPADGTTTIDITGLPNPTDFELEGPARASGTTTDGTLQLTFDTPGTYTLTLRAWPHQDYVVTLNAT